MRLLTLLVALGTAILATAAEPPLPGKDAAADAAQLRHLQHVYSQRLYEEALPQLAEESPGKAPQKLLPIAQKLWDEVYGPHRPLLKRRVVETLRDLDQAVGVEAEKYALIDELNGWPKADDDLTELGRCQAMAFWNPLTAADVFKTMLMSRKLGPAEYGKVALLYSLAHPAWQVVDRDPEHPKLLQQMGPELVVVELQRKDDSYYLPGRIRWLRLKQKENAANTGQPHSPPSTDQRGG